MFPVIDTDLSQDSCQAQFFWARGLQAIASVLKALFSNDLGS